MKTTFLATALALTGSVFALPQAQGDGPGTHYPYSIGELSLTHHVNEDNWSMVFTLTHRSPAGQTVDAATCYTAWVNGTTPAGTASPEECSHDGWSFFFPTGAPNVERYRLAADGPGGQAVTVVQSGDKYACEDVEGEENIDVRCKSINGGLFWLGY
ncbi:hypothetical protein BJX64DRAFT_289884 [Aspergillus heterothallicus]